MRLCPRCGRANEPDAGFCQDCGADLGSAADQETEAHDCPACGAANPADSRFCQRCGVRMEPQSRHQDTVARQPCPVCGKNTPAGFAFCQFCGSRLPGRGDDPIEPTPPAGLPKPSTSSWAVQSPGQSDGKLLTTDQPDMPSDQTIAIGGTGQTHATADNGPRPPTPSQPLDWTMMLTVLSENLSVMATHPIVELPFDIGRTEGQVSFPDDPYMSMRHARIQAGSAGFELVDLGSVNGVYLKIRKCVLLQDGDEFIMGGLSLRFVVLEEWEKTVRPAVDRGVKILGSALPSAWGKLLVISQGGTVLECHYLTQPEIELGHSEADINFPYDLFLSNRHAQMKVDNDHVMLCDLGSTTGTFVRIQGSCTLRPQDVVMVGRHLLRFESKAGT